MADVTVDPRVYGGTSVQEETLHAMSIDPRNSTAPAAPASSTEAQTTFADVKAPLVEAEGKANLARLQRPPVSIFDSAAAAASQWAFRDIYRWVTSPDFPPEAGFDSTRNLQRYGLNALTKDERSFLLDTHSKAEQDWAAEQLKRSRKAHQAMGDHPFISAMTTMVDLTFLPLDIAAPVVSNFIGTGRAGAAAIGAAGAGAITYGVAQARPVGEAEIFGNILMGMGGAALAYRNGRIELADPEHPSGELQEIAKDIRSPVQAGEDTKWVRRADPEGNEVSTGNSSDFNTNTVREPTVARSAKEAEELKQATVETKQVADEITPSEDTFKGTHLEGVQAGRGVDRAFVERVVANSPDPVVSAMWRHLKEKAGPLLDKVPVHFLNAKEWAEAAARLDKKWEGRAPIGSYQQAAGVYLPSINAVIVRRASDPRGLGRTVVHELSHAATVAKLTYGAAHPESTLGRITQQLEDIRKNTIKNLQRNGQYTGMSAYLAGKNVREFVAGLYTGDTAFLRQLSRMRDPMGGKNLLSRAVDAIRRVLGMPEGSTNALFRSIQLTDDLIDAGFDNLHAPASMPPTAVVAQVNKASAKAGNAIAWNLHKTVARWSKRVADLVYDNPVNKGGTSAEAHRQAILRGLESIQAEAEPVVRQEMARRGAGTAYRIRHPKLAVQVYDQVNREITREALNMGDAARAGVKYTSQAPELIQKAAKLYTSDLGERALKELQSAGVEGSGLLKYRDGFFSRRWEAGKIENLITRMGAHGIDRKAAIAKLNDFVTDMVIGGNTGIDPEVAKYIGRALVDRAIRKGEFIDSSFHAHIGTDAAREVEDMLKAAGVPANRIGRVMDVLTSKVDEAGKASFLKRRVELDSQMRMRMPDGTSIDLLDMIDTDMNNIADRYVHGVAGQAALARKGIMNASDIGKLRTEVIDGAPMRDKQEAARIFDQSMNFILGRPTGAAMSRGIRKLQAVNRMIGLGASGLWQLTEYSRLMAQYGLGKTLRYSLENIPPFRNMMGMDKAQAGSLQSILATQSSQDLRLRPYIKRLEDNYEWHHSDFTELVLQQAQQLVPYFNGMKYIHHHQAMVAANCIVDTLQRGARGEAKAIEVLQQYGMDAATLKQHSKSILDSNIVESWPDGTWEAVRPALTKMMDDGVLKNRLGEVPAFAQFDPVGKFVFTFRSFVLGAHNKILASDLSMKGLAGVSLVAMYQFPLMLLMSQASNVLAGRGLEKDNKKLIAQAIAQAGIMGAFGDILGAAMGTKSQFGSPGLIAIDKGFRLASDIGHGQFGQATNDVLGVVGVVPGIRALGALVKQTDD